MIVNETENEMTEEEFFPRAKRLTLTTGNVIKWGSVPVNTNASDYVSRINCLHSCPFPTGSQLYEFPTPLLERDLTDINLNCPRHQGVSILDSDRNSVRVTVKLFLYADDPIYAEAAINSALELLEIEDIEILIVAFSPEVLTDSKLQDPLLESYLKIWPKLEELESKSKLITVGVCDLSLEQLIILNSKVNLKPQVDQILLDQADPVPTNPGLRTYAQNYNIQLLAHQDPLEILPPKKLQNLLSKYLPTADAKGWNPLYLLRYTTMLPHQGIISARGFQLLLQRPNY
ncbi:hypothetical protein Ciccas_007922 [Cichlidogyrus casuarinus]|uniref:GCS light chain n=1 Tax=Cichlidogyrus casuarinus TaxID=1844966 RepID=A0ABD2Q1H0_9PLAT